jgi:hypothetical protein
VFSSEWTLKQDEVWQELRARGKLHYVLRIWVVGWGLTTALAFNIITNIPPDFGNIAEIVFRLILSFIAFPATGLLFGLGSCPVLVHRRRWPAHATDERGRDPLSIDERLIGRDVVGQIALVDTTEHAQEGSQCGASTFATVAMHLADAVSIIVARPFVLAVLDRRVRRRHPLVAPILIRVDDRPDRWNRLGDDAFAGDTIRMSDDPAAFFAGLSADDMDDRRPVVVHRPVTWSFVRSTARWIIGVEMGRTFFPPRSDTVRRPRMSRPAWFRLAHCH